MIDFYTWSTPNGRKVSIMLEETEMPYKAIPININQGDQDDADFRALNQNGKIPVIVDHDTGTTLSESGAILFYLADKSGQFLSANEKTRYETLQWMMFQMAHLGPVCGQVHHFTRFNPGKSEYAEQRFLTEAKRLYSVLDQRLSDKEFIVDDYSIVDMATWPWIARYNWQTIDLNDYDNLKRWYVSIARRPAVQKAWQVPPTDQPLLIPQ